MVFTLFSSLSNLIFTEISGYIFMFIAIIIEGPIVTSSAGFAASLGYFNVWIVLLLSILGNIIGDITHYFFGRFFRKKIIDKKYPWLRIDEKLILNLENKLKNNLKKNIFIIKITPPLSSPGLIITGVLKVPFIRFFNISLLTTIPLAFFYTFLGFYFGFAIDKVMNYLKLGQYSLFFIIIVIIGVYFFYRKFFTKMSKKLKK